ncbi:GNAT family N-acetyltransferase [Deinococcus sp. 12RED42]|uniref:GNAT family N-acetyltransferase n=1 Tax=Deinococcus sp. 12RED42 TaxID=2745872 RepID=UPI001E6234BF|nr:GNAT family N-acetyltransferase [Deinococcus sp. 12RED42]MCD0167205.1 GNAT family N-acetyltransferase [Deinococcus sp. 12RED42]
MRPVTPADAATIAAHRYPDARDLAERPAYAAWVADAIQEGLYLGFLLEGGGEVIAGAGVTLLQWGPTRGDPQPWRARVVNVWTHPDHRRAGHARTLVTACLDALRARGVTRVSLGSSDMARPLYSGLGFVASPHEMTLTLLPD